RAFGDYTRWSVFERHCLMTRADNAKCALAADGSVDVDRGGNGVIVVIPRDWKDTFGVRAGGSYFVSEALEAFAGLGYDSNAIPDETLDSSVIDMDKITSSVGVRYVMLDGTLSLMGTFTNVFYVD